jgi:hypothetical protein
MVGQDEVETVCAAAAPLPLPMLPAGRPAAPFDGLAPELPTGQGLVVKQ